MNFMNFLKRIVNWFAAEIIGVQVACTCFQVILKFSLDFSFEIYLFSFHFTWFFFWISPDYYFDFTWFPLIFLLNFSKRIANWLPTEIKGVQAGFCFQLSWSFHCLPTSYFVRQCEPFSVLHKPTSKAEICTSSWAHGTICRGQNVPQRL